MSYRVTYTTATEPTDLPEGATVEKISLLPVEIGKDSITPFSLEKSEREDHVAFFWVNGQSKWLDREQTTQVRDALNELLGESAPVEEWDGHSEPPADVLETKDKDGDHWFRARNGKWAAYGMQDNGDDWDNPQGGYPAKYGPHTIVRRK